MNANLKLKNIFMLFGILTFVSFTSIKAQQSPYGGTPWPIPGTIQSEDYDEGGQGVAYNDGDEINHGSFRTTEWVDAENCGDEGGGYNVGFTGAGEWMEYTVNVAETGNYLLEVRSACGNAGISKVHFEFNDVRLSDTIELPSTGGWQTYATTTSYVQLTAGEQVMKFVIDEGGMNLNYYKLTKAPDEIVAVTGVNLTPAENTITIGQKVQLTAEILPENATNKAVTWKSTYDTVASVSAEGIVMGVTSGTTQIIVTTQDGEITDTTTITVNEVTGRAPFGGTAWAIPGKIEAEDFDLGGEGVAYHDNDVANSGGKYRPYEGVDVESGASGFDIGWTNTGEWMEYTVNVDDAGVYSVNIRSAINSPGKLHLEFEGENATENVDLPSTGGWANYADNNAQVIIKNAGEQIMRYSMDGGAYNLDYFVFTYVGPYVATTGVTVDPTSASLEPAETQQLSATVAPANATNSNVSWSSSDETVATVDANGLVTAVAVGSATITVTTADGGFTATSEVTVQTSATKNPLANNISVMPNPVKNNLMILLNGNTYNTVKVYNLTGKLQFSQDISLNNGTVKLDMSELNTGMYFVQLINSNSSKLVKVVKE